jgi:hypothetical protein
VVPPGREQPRGAKPRIVDDVGPYPSYVGSYTDLVVTNLWRCYGAAPAAQEAVALLKQYHRDLHIPYEQRDQARRERDTARHLKDVFKAIIGKIRGQRDLYKSEAEKAREHILNQKGAIERLKDEIKRLQAVTANCRDHRSDYSALITELKMARGVVAYHNLYGTTTVIDRAIEELSK